MRITRRHAALHDAFRYTFAATIALIAALTLVYGTLLFVASRIDQAPESGAAYEAAE